MVEVAKNLSTGVGGTMISDLKSYFPLLPTRKIVAFAYFFMFSFVVLIAIFAFGPSSNSASPWAPSIFLTARTNSTTPSLSDQSYGSHFSSIFSYFFPNSSQVVLNSTSLPSPTDVSRFPSHTVEPSSSKVNQTVNEAPITSAVLNEGSSSAVNNLTQSNQPHDKAEVLKQNQSISESPNSLLNGTVNSTQGYSPTEKNITGNGDQKISENGVINNFTSSFASKKDNDTSKGLSAKQENGNMLLKNCDIYNGNWVRDDSYPLYEPGSCSLIDEQFNCFLNRRPDDGYYKLKWKPNGCDLPRLNGSHMLELLRGKRVVFVGDSLNRNMWESLVCILRKSVKNQKKVYEASGRHHFRSEASYSFIFEDYKFSVEFFVAPFLVQEWEMESKNGTKKETLRLDLMEGLAEKYKSAEIIIFNTGHWWTHEKTSKGQDYYQEGRHIYAELNVHEAFRKALTTWGRWVDANINSKKSLLLFRGYSASHFSGGQWNSGGQCDNETEPIMNESYLTPYPDMMTILESVLKGTKTLVSYMNITRLTDFRKDGHPSVYRKQNLPEAERRSPLMFQDCSHWCLPGVPDAWNELLYAELLRKLK